MDLLVCEVPKSTVTWDSPLIIKTGKREGQFLDFEDVAKEA